MSEKTKGRIVYWTIIAILLVWVANQHEQVERYKYNEIYLRVSIRALQERVLGLQMDME